MNKPPERPHETGEPHPKVRIRDRFIAFSKGASNAVGSVWSFLIAILIVVIWAIIGPIFHYSDTWQLVINTGTTIVTFMMVFLIQSTQNRDAQAVHLKLDELIRAVAGARNNLVDLEHLSEEELERLAVEFAAFREKACATVSRKQARRLSGNRRPTSGAESEQSVANEQHGES